MSVEELAKGVLATAVADLLYGTKAAKHRAKEFLLTDNNCEYWCKIAKVNRNELVDTITDCNK